MDTTGPRLESRLRTLSRRLCTSLDAAIRSALGAGMGGPEEGLRPVQLTAKLGLDKSLASRVVRAIHSDDPIRALYRLPTPQGLALVARAAEKAGAHKAQVMALMEASVAYGELLAEFSGGRTDLEATLAGWIPEQRHRAERDARRAVFRGMTTLSGTRTSAIYSSLYLVPPSADSESARAAPDAGPSGPHVNSMAVMVRQDMRRLRSDARLHALSLQAVAALPMGASDDQDQGALVHPRARFTLDGAPLAEDPAALLLRELCSHPPPKLVLHRTGAGVEVSVHADALDVNEFATIGMGWRTEGHFARYATPSRRFGSIRVAATSPTEALVFDLFLHRELSSPSSPFASVSVGRGGPGHDACVNLDPDLPPRPQIEATRDPVNLDAHPSGLASPDVRACGAIAENACREAGYRLAEFSKYRFRIAFPTPTEELIVWWELPEP